MGTRRTSSRENEKWLDPSQVFTDTRRIDLFNDPKWEPTPTPTARRAATDETHGPSRWVVATTAVMRRVLRKRGQHSRHLV